jgi:hypothetical protein
MLVGQFGHGFDFKNDLSEANEIWNVLVNERLALVLQG